MPKAIHDKLAREAAQKGLKSERRDAYVYGTMQRIEHGPPPQMKPGRKPLAKLK